ncbi:nuclear mitotic apparatus protein 1 [Arapaima gigas]
MALHPEKEDALLVWVNSFKLGDPVHQIFLLQDGTLLVKLIHKLIESDKDAQTILDLPAQGRLEFVSNFLQKDCQYKGDRGATISWDNILSGTDLDLELSKVVVLLLYHSVMNGPVGYNRLDYKIETELASVLRFVLCDEDHLYLSDNLEKYLKGQRIYDMSSVSSTSSFSDEESPVFSMRRRPAVHFLELKTVASSSVGSPIQDILKTPQFQLRKLQKQLCQERDMRDELEREIASSHQIITERETQIIQLQHRVQRMMRDNAEHDQQPKEMEELLSKNEGLIQRLHEVLKQCQDLKTNKHQMEKKIDDLTEENGILSVQIREVASLLSSAQAAVVKLNEEQQSSQAEWESKRALLESELSQALSQKEYLSEQIQILQGKISILEDELSKANAETQVGGEVMGPILEWERLTQEIADLTQKLSQHQERILQLEKEKDQVETLHNEDKAKFEAEISRLQTLISELTNALNAQQNEKEVLEQKSREQQVILRAQIEALSADITCLTEIVQQRELDVANLRQQVEEEQRRGKELTEVMAKKEQVAQETIQGLSDRVDHLGNALKVKEVEMLSKTEEWDLHRSEISHQQELLKEAHDTASKERDAVTAEYHHFRQEKEEVVCKLNHQIMHLEEQQRMDQSLSLQLRQEKQELEEKVASLEAAISELRIKIQSLELDSEVQRMHHLEVVDSLKDKLQEAEETLQKYEVKLADHCRIVEEHVTLCNKLSVSEISVKELRDELEAERRKHEDTIAAELQKNSEMVEELGKLERKTEKMSVELEHLSRELGKTQEEKLYAEACVAKLTEEGREVANALTAARDQALVTIKEREAEIVKLSSEAELLSNMLKQVEETKAKELAAKEEGKQLLAKEFEQTQMELEVVKKEKEVLQLSYQSDFEKHQEQVSALRLIMTDAEESAKQKGNEIENLKAELAVKEDELKTQHETVLSLQNEKVQREELQKQVNEEKERVLLYKEDVDAKNKEVHLLKMTLMTKDDEIKSLLQSIKAAEAKTSVSQDLLERKIEEHKQSVYVLELQLSDVNKLLAEKESAVEMQKNDILSLQEKFSLEHERAVSLEQNLKVSEFALQNYKRKQDALRMEAVSYQDVINKLKENLLEVRQECKKFRAHTTEISGILHVEWQKMVGQLQVKMQEAFTFASKKESELDLLQVELKEKDNLRIQASEAYESQCKVLENKISQLNEKLVEVANLASEKESELNSLRKEVEEKDNMRAKATEKEEAQRKEMEDRIAQLQAQVTKLSSLASERKSELDSLHKEMKEKDNLRVKEMEAEETRHKEMEEKIAHFEAKMIESSSLASKREAEMESLHMEIEMELVQRKELENRIAQLQAQVTESYSLASERELELESLRKEMKEKENLRLKAIEMEEIQHKEVQNRITQLQVNLTESSTLAAERKSELDSLRKAMEMEQIQYKELENRIAQLQAQVTVSSALAADRESEIDSLRKEIKEKDNMSLKALEMEAGRHKQLQERIAQLQTQLTESSVLASERQSELDCLHNEVKDKDRKADVQRIELEGTINQLKEELRVSTSLASAREQVIEKLNEDLRRIDVMHHESLERDAARLRALAAEEQNRKELEETVTKLKQEIVRLSVEKGQAEEHLQEIKLLKLENGRLLQSKDTLLKEQEACKQAEASLERKLELASQELATLHPLRDSMAEKDQLISELKEHLQNKSEALEHYKLQVEKAKTHYNGKKQQVLEAHEKVQTLEKALESSEQEMKTLKVQMTRLQTTVDQTKLSEKNLVLKVNSLQAQVDYADRQLREQVKLQGRKETLKTSESVSCRMREKQEADEKQEDLSKDSLDLGLDDSLNATRRPFAKEESSTPLVRSSERLAAKRRALGGESLETLYFTPMNNRDHNQRNVEGSILSLGDLALDSAKKVHSARRRTKQVFEITMTKKTPIRPDFDNEYESFYSLQSAQSYPNLTSEKDRFISTETFEEPVAGDQLRNLPGYRQSTTRNLAPHRNSSTFAIGAENEPELTEDWMRIAELQARNKSCLPHLKSSYPLESRPSLGIPSFLITDEDLKMGDPNETIRRATMLPGQIREGLPSHRASMLPGQISAEVTSRRATLAPKLPANGGTKTGGVTLSLKRSANDLQGPDTPEAKKMASCFPRPMTPKDRNDRRFAFQNNQNKPPNTPVERRQSMMFSIENTPKKNVKSNILQRGINKMRGSTRKSPGSVSRVTRAGKSPGTESTRPQRRSPRITRKSPKITASAKKIMSYKSRMKV